MRARSPRRARRSSRAVRCRESGYRARGPRKTSSPTVLRHRTNGRLSPERGARGETSRLRAEKSGAPAAALARAVMSLAASIWASGSVVLILRARRTCREVGRSPGCAVPWLGHADLEDVQTNRGGAVVGKGVVTTRAGAPADPPSGGRRRAARRPAGAARPAGRARPARRGGRAHADHVALVRHHVVQLVLPEEAAYREYSSPLSLARSRSRRRAGWAGGELPGWHDRVRDVRRAHLETKMSRAGDLAQIVTAGLQCGVESVFRTVVEVADVADGDTVAVEDRRRAGWPTRTCQARLVAGRIADHHTAAPPEYARRHPRCGWSAAGGRARAAKTPIPARPRACGRRGHRNQSAAAPQGAEGEPRRRGARAGSPSGLRSAGRQSSPSATAVSSPPIHTARAMSTVGPLRTSPSTARVPPRRGSQNLAFACKRLESVEHLVGRRLAHQNEQRRVVQLRGRP